MLFKRKNKETCNLCKSKIEKDFSYCPYCGRHVLSKEQEIKEFGMLGKDDFSEDSLEQDFGGFGITDKIIGSVVNSLMKNFDKQFKELEKAEIKPIPNGISISIGPSINKKQEKPKANALKRGPNQEQLKKISLLPRTIAKSNVKRLGNKIVYELGMSGIRSPEDIFVSKLENGYEIKAISDKNVYVNTIPLDLPVKSFKIDKDKLTVEFKTEY